MKRTISILLAAIVVLSGLFGLTACQSPTHTHTYSVQNTDSAYLKTPATCENPAVYYYSCACGAKGTTTFTSGSALGHSYTSEIMAPTCTEQGYTLYTCSRCGYSYKKSYVDATGHTDDGTGHCSVCGEGCAHTHVFNVQNKSISYLVSEATCTSPGIYHYSCACGVRGTETFETPIDSTNHGTIERVFECVDGTHHLVKGVCADCGETTSSRLEEHREDGDNPTTCRRCHGKIEE